MCCCCLSCGDFILFIIAIIFPPFPVIVRRGLCSSDLIINVMLCMFGYIPGLLHAWYIVANYPPYYDLYDEERQLMLPPHGGPNCHVVYVSVPSPQVQSPRVFSPAQVVNGDHGLFCRTPMQIEAHKSKGHPTADQTLSFRPSTSCEELPRRPTRC